MSIQTLDELLARSKPEVMRWISNAVEAASLNGITISLPDNVAYLDSEQTFTDRQFITTTTTLADSNSYAGLVSNFIVDPSGDSTGIRIGSWSQAYMQPGNVNDELAIWGAAAYGLHYGTGLVGTLAGIVALSHNRSTGDVTTAVAVSGQIKNDAAGDITGAATFWAQSPVIAAGTVGAISGVEINNQGAAGVTLAKGLSIAAQSGATTNYAIYSAGGDVQLNNTSTLTSGAGIAVYEIYSVTPSGASSATFDAMQGVTISSGAQNITGSVRGVTGAARHDGSGTVTILDGVFGFANNNGNGTVTNAYGVRGAITVGASATTTNAYSFVALAPSVSGTLTSIAQVAIVDPGAGTNRTNLLIGTATIPAGTFSLYNSSTENNYIAGNVGIGTVTFGASLAKGLAFGNGTAASAVLTDGTMLWSEDYAAGDARLMLWNEAMGAASPVAPISEAAGLAWWS